MRRKFMLMNSILVIMMIVTITPIITPIIIKITLKQGLKISTHLGLPKKFKMIYRVAINLEIQYTVQAFSIKGN
jgi:hypothetical protein